MKRTAFIDVNYKYTHLSTHSITAVTIIGNNALVMGVMDVG